MGKTDKAAALISEAALAVAKLDLAVQVPNDDEPTLKSPV